MIFRRNADRDFPGPAACCGCASDSWTTRPYRRMPRSLILPMLLLSATAARAQDIEPRAFSNAPIGVNFLGVGYAFTQGSLPTNPSLPLTDSHLTTSSALLGYGHVFDLWGQSAKVNSLPPTAGSAATPSSPANRSSAPSTASSIQASRAPSTSTVPRRWTCRNSVTTSRTSSLAPASPSLCPPASTIPPAL